MIHRIHSGPSQTRDFTIWGFGNSKNNFNNVLYPGDLTNCAQCHLPGTNNVPTKAVAKINDTRGYIGPVAPHGRLSGLPRFGERRLARVGQHVDTGRELQGVPRPQRGLFRGHGPLTNASGHGREPGVSRRSRSRPLTDSGFREYP